MAVYIIMTPFDKLLKVTELLNIYNLFDILYGLYKWKKVIFFT